MKLWLTFRLLMLIFVGVLSACEKSPGGETAPIPFVPRPEIPVEQKISQLDTFIRAAMKRDNIPGLSVALLRDGKVVWTRGYGVANSVTRRELIPDTPLEAASLGKCLTTYAALKLVQDGRLDLKKPLSSYLREQFVADSPYRDQITAWNVMTIRRGSPTT